MKTSFLKYLALGALGLAGCLPAAGQVPASQPTVVLFVGNSFFHGKFQPVLNYNQAGVKDENFGLAKDDPRFEFHEDEPGPWSGIPGIFQKLTEEAGLRYEVHLEAISGKTLKYHYEHALPIIQQAKWQVVVLQESSTGALPTRRTGHPDAFTDYASKLAQTVRTANPAARLYLYQTWPRADLTYPAAAPYAGLPLDSMTHDLHAAYYGLLRQDARFSGVAPVGDAWLRAVQSGVAMPNPYQPEAGKIDLWGADHFHPSQWGAYLNACVLLAEITGTDPRTLGAREQAAATLGIAPAQAEALQRIAYEQVRAARPTAFAKPAKGRKVKIKMK
ncbi:MAG: DUF4886 domain-containing protein [Janthinobacterium lividum]